MKVFLVPNYARPDAVEGALEHWLSGQGVEAVWAHDKKRFPNYAENPADCQLVVSLGGDGTLLRAARIVGYSQIPMLGISYGHLGFLTTAGPSRLIQTVQSALDGKLHVSHRATLSIESDFECEDGSSYQVDSFALNDFAVSRGGQGDMVQFEVSVSGNHIDTLRGDGFVTPEFSGMVCVPIAPHTIMARAFLTAPSDVVEIEMSPERPVECHFFADGQNVRQREEGVPVHATVRRGPGDILLLDHSAQSFYNSVSRVFYGRAGR